MRKKYLSALLFGALLFASTATFTSCKDYDDDIANLQEQVDKVVTDIKTLQDAAGKYVTSVVYDATTGKLTVTGGNGETYQLPMPEEFPTYTLEVNDGKIYLKENGTVISEATLPQSPEVSVPDAFDPELLAWGNDGYLYYGTTKIEGVQKPVFDASITELKDNNEVTGYIVTIGEDQAVFYVKSDLKSLVFKPEFYLDGIEAMEVKYMPYQAIVKPTGVTNAKYKNVDYVITEPNNYRANKATAWTYLNPEMSVEYQMNPSSANVEDFKDGLSFISDDKQFINFSTSRTAQSDPTVKGTLESVENGDIRVSFNVKGQYVAAQADALPAWGSLALPADAKVADDPDYVTHMALQANLKNGVKDTTITSDYAALYASQFRLENIVYAETAETSYYQFNPTNLHSEPDANGIHLYTQVKDAVEHDPTIKVAWDGKIDLTTLTSVHFYSNSKTPFGNKGEYQTLTADDLIKYNLKFKYELVENKAGVNATSESNNCELKAYEGTNEAYKGDNTVLDPCGVYGHGTGNNEGLPTGIDGIETVGRMPLVRVTVVDTQNGNQVVELGYIRLMIVESVTAKTTIVFDKGDYYFGGCNADKVKLSWAETQTDILGAAAVSSKEVFDNNYELDVDASGIAKQYIPDQLDENGNPKTYKLVSTVGSETATSPFIVGAIDEEVDPTAPTTTCLMWKLDEDDYKNLRRYATVDKNKKTIQYAETVYVRYVGRANNTPGIATKEPIYVPIKITLNYPYAILDNKNTDYWYTAEDKVKGTEAVHFNVEVPGDSHTCEFVKDINAVFTMNKTKGQATQLLGGLVVADGSQNTTSPSFGVDSKFTEFVDAKLGYVYYFSAANDDRKVKGASGTEYTLSVAHGTVRADKYAYQAGDYDYYLSGVSTEEYNNDVLYADGVKVAVIDQTTGKVTYQENAIAFDILNKSDHKDLKSGETFEATIGVAAFNKCAQLFPIEDNEFIAKFLRPVNVIPQEGKEFTDAVDAGASGSWQYILDLVQLTDWRDYEFAQYLSYFNYYEVEALTVDTDKILTNMNQSDKNTFKLLKDVTDKIIFRHDGASSTVPSATSTLAQLKDHYGKLVYINNEANVHDFDIRVPVTITYKWGTYTVWVDLAVKKTINQE